MSDENLVLRAELERALLLLDRFADYEHDEECEPHNACENGGDPEGPCHFDDDADEMVHDHTSCRCLVWDAATRAKEIRRVLRDTLGNRGTTHAKEKKGT